MKPPKHTRSTSPNLVSISVHPLFSVAKSCISGPASDTGVKWTLAILVSASVDRLVETKGLEYVDKEKAKHDGILQVEEARARNE
jgi:hypothetical protein